MTGEALVREHRRQTLAQARSAVQTGGAIGIASIPGHHTPIAGLGALFHGSKARLSAEKREIARSEMEYRNSKPGPSKKGPRQTLVPNVSREDKVKSGVGGAANSFGDWLASLLKP